jgi:citrate lyase subunit beta/citryl-CoA lyase
MPRRERPRRSALYLPASNPKALAKARALPADVIILDLEDAVSPDNKEAARHAAVQAVSEGGFGSRELVVRINGADTPWGAADLAAVALAAPDAILLPKVNSPADIDYCERGLACAPSSVRIWAMIETCASIPLLHAIAGRAADSRLSAFVMGTNDLAKEMRARLVVDRAPFIPLLVHALVAARAHGISILDGVCNEFRDLQVFVAEAKQGLELGFDGKTLIHPVQIDPCNVVFSPTEEEIAWASAVLEAFALPANSGKGAIQVGGKMVELLHLEQARNLHEIAKQIGSIQRT